LTRCQLEVCTVDDLTARQGRDTPLGPSRQHAQTIAREVDGSLIDR